MLKCILHALIFQSSESSFDSGEEEAKHDFVKAMLRKLKRPKPSPRKSVKVKQKPSGK